MILLDLIISESLVLYLSSIQGVKKKVNHTVFWAGFRMLKVLDNCTELVKYEQVRSGSVSEIYGQTGLKTPINLLFFLDNLYLYLLLYFTILCSLCISNSPVIVYVYTAEMIRRI